jgi:hypothetical protein
VDSLIGEFRVDAVSACEKVHGQEPTAGEGRKKARHPPSEIVEDEVVLDELSESGAAAEDDVAVVDYYSPSEKTDDPAS